MNISLSSITPIIWQTENQSRSRKRVKTSAYLHFTNLRGLYEGIPFILALIGLFAISEVFANIENILKTAKINAKISGVLPGIKDIKAIWLTVVRGGFIGTFVGAVPGAGSDIAAFISYSETKRTSKHPEKFGTGVPEGVATPEAANNGCSGGAMIPLLSLEIPGDSNTAVLMGAFIMQGFQPGTMMYVDHMNIIYAYFSVVSCRRLRDKPKYV